ncbi:unnamed protein product [Ambrosiozyma monospora]|uniref:Unnamed protein product n=1 Tax=Ambrosiozyma monospora TaxID=43982 RepID=A0A9W6Z0B4_AMBMO|nr:unnamed protein product [Ambrosiozyma monospora]
MTEQEQDKVAYLKTIKSVRETNSCTKKLIETNKLHNFIVDDSKLEGIVDFVIETVKLNYPTKESLKTIPIHGRYQHFETGDVPRLSKLIEDKWKGKLHFDDLEICRKLIDLFIVSVLLDAGAGNEWGFTEPSFNTKIGRSEGIAVASFHMFCNGAFSSDNNDKFKVTGDKLSMLTKEDMIAGFQIKKGNEIAGFEGRFELLKRLGSALIEFKDVFGVEGRPGNMIDYLISKKATKTATGFDLELEDLWYLLMTSFKKVWPQEGRLKVYGETIGDAWQLRNRIDESKIYYKTEELPEWSKVVTFHKLTQWLTYSLFLPLMKYGKFNILHKEFMTGLPEYRNGGLLVDFGYLTLKPEKFEQGIMLSKEVGFDPKIPTFKPDDDVIVEWRSCTICLLDKLLPLVNDKMGIKGTEYEMILPQLIEAGSWASGRRIAKKLRSNGAPPIELFADGTVF